MLMFQDIGKIFSTGQVLEEMVMFIIRANEVQVGTVDFIRHLFSVEWWPSSRTVLTKEVL